MPRKRTFTIDAALDGAMELFSERSYHGTSMPAIAEHLKLSHGQGTEAPRTRDCPAGRRDVPGDGGALSKCDRTRQGGSRDCRRRRSGHGGPGAAQSLLRLVCARWLRYRWRAGAECRAAASAGAVACASVRRSMRTPTPGRQRARTGRRCSRSHLLSDRAARIEGAVTGPWRPANGSHSSSPSPPPEGTP